MKPEKIPCALCSQPVEIKGFSLITGDGEKPFCCEGCLSIYQLLNADQLQLDMQTQDKKSNNS